MEALHRLQRYYEFLWENRDKRVDGWPLMGSPLYTVCICIAYVCVVKVAGPRFMRNREPFNLRTFLIAYNFLQVILSTWIFVRLVKGGWNGEYSLRCQPVDYSDSEKALYVMASSYLYYVSKFTEFIDTFAFVLRKKFSHVSTLHVIHHGIMPLSVWPGVRWVPGGHATFFGLINTFVHIFMYSYYMMAAMGPQYQKYVWWKRHMTDLQMTQFVCVFIHSIQLLFVEDCGFPVAYGWYIGAHAVMFFILFSQFYIREYLSKKPKSKGHVGNGVANGVANGVTNGVANGVANGVCNGRSRPRDTGSKKEL